MIFLFSAEQTGKLRETRYGLEHEGLFSQGGPCEPNKQKANFFCLLAETKMDAHFPNKKN